ncbi:MAG: hypothetical protein M1282_08695 [Chloroflexi bacterium]|nr:hypothetical protein [Chloroflexota bacterium]
MRSTTTGTISGCIVWVLVFVVVSSCLLPVAFMVGSFTAETNFAIRRVGPMICPKATTPQIYSYETTMTDDNGFPVNATAYELHCLDSNGNVVKNDPIVFGFLWDGIMVGIALIVTAVLAFLLAAPAGVLISRLFKPKSKSIV